MSNSHLSSVEWINAFRTQLEAARRRGRDFGGWFLNHLAADTLCTADVDEAVADALGDICTGQVSWNYDAVGLPRAVVDLLAARLPRLVKRAHARVPLPDEDDATAVLADEVGEERDGLAMNLATEDLRDTIIARDLARHVVTKLRARITEPAVHRLLDALIHGYRRPAELAQHLGVSLDELRNAHRRLTRCAIDLPEALRPDGPAQRSHQHRRARTNPRADVLDLARLLGLEIDEETSRYFATL